MKPEAIATRSAHVTKAVLTVRRGSYALDSQDDVAALVASITEAEAARAILSGTIVVGLVVHVHVSQEYSEDVVVELDDELLDLLGRVRVERDRMNAELAGL